MAKNNVNSAIRLINSGKNIPAISLVKNNPEIAATISKLILSRDGAQYDNSGNRKISSPDQSNFAGISKEIAEKTTDAESINQLFPDMELSAQILISSILSPKDMSKVELAYIAPKNLKSSEINSSLINKVKDHFDRVYKIEPMLPKILRQMLFESGSYPVAIIPENSIDDLINGTSKITQEGLNEVMNTDGTFKNTGILGDPTKKEITNRKTALENITHTSFSGNYNHFLTCDGQKITELVNITDNPHALKMPQIIKKSRAAAVSNIVNKGARSPLKSLESFGLSLENNKLTDSQLTDLIYKSKHTDSKPFIKVKTNAEVSRESIGKPLIMKLPSEAVIPVFTPGNEEKHVGYFILIDSEGNPLSKSSQLSHFDDLQSKINNSSNNMSSFLLSRAKKTYGSDCTSLTMNQASRVYADIVESDLLSRLRNGVYGNDVTIGGNDEIYRIMLSRVFQNQFTQLLYIPVDLVTYFAYKYDDRGIGKSLIDDMRILNSLRAMVLFSKVMASLKNSIGRTEVRLKLDERDPDPQKTIEIAIHEISKTRQQYFPLGLSSPGDLVDWIQKSGMEYTFSGHPRIPDTSIEFSEKNTNYVKPDDELEEDLRKRAIMATGLSPETVDNGFSSEFATTVVSNNLLLAKRVMQIQEDFIPKVTDFVRKVAFNDGTLFNELVGIVTENFDKLKSNVDLDLTQITDNKDIVSKLIVSEFLSNMEVSLPQPNSITLENQMSAFELYTDALDKTIGFYISSDIMINDFSGQAADKADEVKNIVKAYFCRKWLNDNNVLPELAELTISDEDGKPLLDFMTIHSDHLNGLAKSIITLMQRTKPVAIAGDADIAKITGGEGVEESSASDTSSSSDNGSDDDLGTDMDMDDSISTEPSTDDTGTGDDDLPPLETLE